MNTVLDKNINPKSFITTCINEKNKTFYYEALPVKSNYDYCMFDKTDSTRNQVTMLSCNCPKCTVR